MLLTAYTVNAGVGVPVSVSAVPYGYSAVASPAVGQPKRRGKVRTYTQFGKTYTTLASSAGYDEIGVASWYGQKFHGRDTANGEKYDMFKMTAAHTVLPLPTNVEVTNLSNNRQVIVRVNDRGPFHGNRLIDLSHAAAEKLGILEKGTGKVRVRALESEEAAAKIATKRSSRNRRGSQPSLGTENNGLIYIDGRLFAAAGSYARHEPRHRFTEDTALDAEIDRLNHAGRVATSIVGRESVIVKDEVSSVFVQAGAFSSADKALNMATLLRQSGVAPIKLYPVSTEAGELFRVRIGPFSSERQGRQMMKQLLAVGHSNTLLIK